MLSLARPEALLEFSCALSTSLDLDEVSDRFRATAAALTGASSVTVRLGPEDAPEAPGALVVPLVAAEETFGRVEFTRPAGRAWNDEEIAFCRDVVGVAACPLRNALLYAELHELAGRDKLTGLYNRRLFEDQLEAAVARSARHGEALALLVVDLDGLKRINDLGGHPAGDAALRALAEALRSSVRVSDVACRLGGDEFAVILPASSREDAVKVAQRAQRALRGSGPERYTFSGGVARVSSRRPSADDVYAAADAASYRAKAAGGARTLLASEGE